MRAAVRPACAAMLIGLTMLSGIAALGADVALTWDPPVQNTDGTPLANLAGYRLSWGRAVGVYDTALDVGNVTTRTLTNLTEGATYHAAAKAYNSAGRESAYCTELVFTVPDLTAPVIAAPAARTLEASADGTAAVPDFTGGLSVTDNVSPRAQITVTQTPAAGSLVGVGVTVVTLRAADAAGNAAQATVTLTVRPILTPSAPRNLRVVPK